MSIGDIAAGIQIAIWLIAAIVFVGRIWVKTAKGEAVIPQRLRSFLSSNLVIGAVIAMGLLVSGISVYPTISKHFTRKSITVTISAYPIGTETLTVIRDQTFENQDVPLDGRVYDNCTFVNSCLLYDGGAYQLQNVTFKDHWKVCVKEPQLKNYSSLMFALGLMNTGTKQTSKTVIPFKSSRSQFLEFQIVSSEHPLEGVTK